MSQLFSTWSTLNSTDKFYRILSISSAIRFKQYAIEEDRKLEIDTFLSHIEELRYELAHNKATESNTSHLDRTLATIALHIAGLEYRGERLKKYVESFLYYEKDEAIIDTCKQLLS
jgi:hypothetical protein